MHNTSTLRACAVQEVFISNGILNKEIGIAAGKLAARGRSSK